VRRRGTASPAVRGLSYAIALMLSFAAGMVFARFDIDAGCRSADVPRKKPAYLLASWNVLHPAEMRPFAAAILPLAREAGMDTLAAATPAVLEGRWPYEGPLFVQRYDSMQALLKFWRSPEHDRVKKLREGHVDTHFIVAVEEAD
jgi:uncharacterized protein (DUF1330 family)